MEQSTQQKEQAEKLRQVVKFTNIDKEDFTHTYNGIPTTIAAGESKHMMWPEGELFAKHLAQKILMREKPVTFDGRRDDTKVKNLFPPEKVAELKAKILQNVDLIRQEVLTPQEKHDKELADLALKYEKPPEKPPTPYVDKKDVIAELEKRGIKVDRRRSREELLKQLMEHEAQPR